MKTISIVYNPTKITDLADHVAVAATLCREHGYDKPVWLETEADDPGYSMAKQAVESGADLVVAMGGDGTVRFVASALRGTGVPMGIVPVGTGNLLCRNLDIPLNDFETALTVALAGADRPIDVGLVRFDDKDEEVFLVVAGVGVDGDTMANTNENLKKMVGWFAYVASGARALLAEGFRTRVTNDPAGPDPRPHRARSYMVCNCGILTGGLVLVPEAEPDDGHLDTLVLAPHGPLGWAAVITDLVTRHRRGHKRMRHWTTHRAEAFFDKSPEGQIDGDAVGPVRRMHTGMDTGALVVRVPTE